MAIPETDRMQPKGSWLLKILIVILIVVLLASVMYPQKLWREQSAMMQDTRDRMENLNYVVQRFNDVRGTYVANVDSLISFIESDSIEIERPVFEFERLSLFDADADSFLVGFIDKFHYDSLKIDRISENSVELRLIPKPRFMEVVDVTGHTMSCPRGIEAFYRDKGEDDIYVVVYAPGKIVRGDLPYEPRVVPSQDWILFRDLADVSVDPITGQQYVLDLNMRLTLEASIEFTRVRRGEPDPVVTADPLILNILMNNLARRARGQLDNYLREQEDSTLYEADMQASLASDFFENEVQSLMSTRRPRTVEQSRDISIPIDSVDYYSQPENIRNKLFHQVTDQQIRQWQQREDAQALFAQMEYEENYFVSSTDTVGVRIEPPFEDDYALEPRNFMDQIFSVGPLDYPGYINNNDLSWEEKR